MLSAIIWFVLGLFVGWFFLPTPAIATTLADKLTEQFPSLAKYRRRD